MRVKLRPQHQFYPKYIKVFKYSTYHQPPSPESTPSEIQAAKTYCSNLLRKHDSPSYTLQTFIPPHILPAYLALRALNIELTLIPDSVSTSQIGTLRIQFWREKILSALSLKPAAHPVPILLSHAIRTGAPLSQSWLLRLISSREQYLSNPPYPTLAALEQYAENTYSTLLYLTLSALPMTSLPADHLASHIGKATGIAAVLRGLPLLAFPPPPNHHSKSPTSSPQRTRQGTVPLPLDIMATAGLKEEDVLRHGSTAPGLRDAVFAVATRASDHLITARQMLKNLRAGNDVGHAYEHEGEEGHQYTSSPSRDLDVDGSTHQQVAEIEQAFGVLMPAVSTALWLERLESADFDVFHPALRAREWKLPWRAYWAYRRRMF